MIIPEQKICKQNNKYRVLPNSRQLKIATLLLSSIMLTACLTSPSLPEQQRPAQWGQMVHRDHNFYRISDWLYRSEKPEQDQLPILKEHGIDIVINLRSRDRDQALLSAHGFELVHLPVHTWNIQAENLLQVMRVLEKAKAQNKKVLIHCYHGSDRTGANIAMYRIIFENWTAEQALAEMKYGGYGFHPIWLNIEKLFIPEKIKWVQEQLSNPS